MATPSRTRTSPRGAQAPPPARARDAVQRVAERVQQFLFGHDVFISYARADAKEYAVGLAGALIERRIAAYVDQFGTPPGAELPPLLMRRLALSSMLVLIASRGARMSDAVRHEVEEFRRRNHRIYVVAVDGALADTAPDGPAAADHAGWLRDIARGATTAISRGELEGGLPSAALVEWVVQRMEFTRREDRLRATLRRTLAAIAAVLVLGGSGIAVLMNQAAVAGGEARAAVRARNDATRQQKLAEDSARVASRRAAEAAALRLRAESRAAAAAENEKAARAGAEEQRRVARALNLANHATAALDGSLTGLTRSVLLATESLKRAWTPEGYAAWLDGMRLLPRGPDVRVGRVRDMTSNVVVSRDGRRVAVADTTGRVRVLALPSGTPIDSVIGVPATGRADQRVIALSPDGRWLVAYVSGRTGAESGIRVAEVGTRRRDRLPRACGHFAAAAFGATPRTVLALACHNERVLLYTFDGAAWREDTLTPPPSAGGRRYALALAVSPDGRRLAVGEGTGLALWDLTTRRLVGEARARPAWGVAFHPDGRTIATSERDKLRLWTVKGAEDTSGKPVLSEQGVSWDVTDPSGIVEFSPDGRYLLTGDVRLDDGSASGPRLWDVATGRETSRLVGTAGTPTFTPGGHAVLGGSMDGGVAAWAIEQGAENTRLALGRAPRHVAFSPDGRWFAASDSADTTRVFDAGTWREVVRLPGGATGVGFTPDGRWLVTAGADIRLSTPGVWRGARALARQALQVDSAAVSPDGRWLATWAGRDCYRATSESEVRVWHVATAREVAWRWDGCRRSGSGTLNPPPRTGGRMALLAQAGSWPTVVGGRPRELRSADGRWVVSTLDTTVVLREAPTGRQIGVLAHDRASDLAFSPDGATLAMAGGGRELRLWLVGPGARDRLVRESCARLGGRSLTASEWRVFLPGEAFQSVCRQPRSR